MLNVPSLGSATESDEVMSHRFDRGLLAGLTVGEIDVVDSPWGFETSDAYQFYSLESRQNRRVEESSAMRTSASDEIHLTEGRAALELITQLTEGSVEATVRQSIMFCCITDFWAVDVVNRCRFPEQVFEFGEVAGTQVFKDHSYYYHQQPVTEARLSGRKVLAEIKVVELQAPPSLSLFTYIKSTETEWIVHARLLPRRFKREVLKWNGRPLFERITDPLLRGTPLGKLTRYAGEFNRYPGSRRLQSFPMALLPVGTEIKMTIEVNFKRV